jgi:hypothetical protein
MRRAFRGRRQVVLTTVLLAAGVAAVAGLRGSGHGSRAGLARLSAAVPAAYDGGTEAQAEATAAAVARRRMPPAAAAGNRPALSLDAVRALQARASSFSGTLHLDGNLDDPGIPMACTGVGAADLTACGGPFLVSTATLSTHPPAHFDVANPALDGTNLRNIYDPNWLWNSGPTTLVGTMTVHWWASCGACAAGTADAEWDISLYPDFPATGYPTPAATAHVTATPSAPNTAELLTAVVPIPAPGITVLSKVLLQIEPFFTDVQANTHIYYDSSLPCPTAIGTTACDSTVTFDPTTIPPPPPPPVPTYTSGNIGFGPATVIDFQRTEGEPAFHIDKSGSYWESGPWGFSTGQSFVHRSTDSGDQFNVASPIGLSPTHPPGGGDSHILTDDQGNVYFNDLEGLDEIACSVSNDLGNSWRTNDGCANVAVTDREWYAVDNGSDHTVGAGGAADNTVFMVYHQLVTGHYLLSSPGSTGPLDPTGGFVFTNAGANAATVAYAGGGNCGKLVFDPVSRNLYYPCGAGSAGAACFGGVGGSHIEITIAHVNPSQRSGLNFNTVSLPNSPGGCTSNLFPLVAVDGGGNVYVAWSDTGDHNIYCSSSPPGGLTWSAPVKVNQAPANSNVFAWAEAGTEGKLAVVWLGSDSTTLSDQMTSWATSPALATAFKWYGYVGLVTGANTATPNVEQDRFTEKPMHYGQICNSGIGCTTQMPMGDRTMADFLSVGVGSNGGINIAYDDTTSQFHGAHLFFERQLSGPGLSRPAHVARPETENPAADPQGDAHWPHYAPTGPGANQDQLDLTGIALNKQDANTLRVRMSVKNIAGFAAPTGKANAFWITRFQTLSKDDSNATEAYRIFYVGAESVAGGAPTFFAGSPLLSPTPPATTGCVGTTPGSCKVEQYPAEITGLTGQVSGNTICIDLPLNAFGATRPIGSLLYNVTAFSGGRNDATADLYADVDSTPSFDYQLGAASPTTCSPPTAVRLLRFTAARTTGGVVVTWRTASESRLAGFNVWRNGDRVNRTLVPATGRSGTYRLVDRTARRGATTYSLQLVGVDGARTWAARAQVHAVR